MLLWRSYSQDGMEALVVGLTNKIQESLTGYNICSHGLQTVVRMCTICHLGTIYFIEQIIWMDLAIA